MASDEILTQDEMDTLLNGVSDGQVEFDIDGSQTQGRLSVYDFAHPAHKLKTRLPLLEVVNDRFIKELANGLSTLIYQPVSVSLEEFSTWKFQEYSHSLPQTVSINRIQLEPLPGTALMCLDGPLVFNLVDSFFGGNGNSSESDAKREFTPTEQRIIQLGITRAFEALIEAWRPAYAITPKFIRTEISTQITSPANPAEVMLTSKFKVTLPLGEGQFHLAIPYATLEPARSRLTAAMDKPRENDGQWAHDFSEMVFDSPVEVQGIIAETEISVGDLLRMQPGDFIPLGQGRQATFYSEEIPLFDAVVGASNGMISAQLIDTHNDIKRRELPGSRQGEQG